MNTQKTINSIRQKIRWHLTKIGAHYEYSDIITKAYNGEGLYINSREKVTHIKKTWGYDKHWAYGGVLRNKVLPLSEELGNKKTELAIYLVSYTKMEPRYKDFYYTLYKTNTQDIEQDIVMLGKSKIYRYMTHIDYITFKDLYIIKDLKIEKKLYFKNVGSLKMEEIIDDFYEKKKKKELPKIIFESCFYGLNCKKLYEYDTPTQYREFKKAYKKTKYLYCRSKYTAIAMWQTAYLRFEEWQLFKKYKDNVVYMNTDSIYTNKPIDIKCSKKVGEYDIEYRGEFIQFIRRCAYVILNKNGRIKECKISGVLNEYVTKKQVEELRKGKIIKVKSRNEDNEIIDIELEPTFIRYKMGLNYNLKYYI